MLCDNLEGWEGDPGGMFADPCINRLCGRPGDDDLAESVRGGKQPQIRSRVQPVERSSVGQLASSPTSFSLDILTYVASGKILCFEHMA